MAQVAAAQASAEEKQNQSSVNPVLVAASITIKTAMKPVKDVSITKTEERQRLARERREEQERQHAIREAQIREKEKKATLQYEKQMEEKQRRLNEQKLKDQLRRTAAEEKRKQKIEENKVHYEAVWHRSLERSQQLDTSQKRWLRDASVPVSDGKTAPKYSSLHAPQVPEHSHIIDKLKTVPTCSSDHFPPEAVQKPKAGNQCMTWREMLTALYNYGQFPSVPKVDKRPPSPAATRQNPGPPSPTILRQRGRGKETEEDRRNSGPPINRAGTPPVNNNNSNNKLLTC